MLALACLQKQMWEYPLAYVLFPAVQSYGIVVHLLGSYMIHFCCYNIPCVVQKLLSQQDFGSASHSSFVRPCLIR